MSNDSPRIQRGAELLDERAPGWEDKIDLPTLNLAHCDLCVLGQVYGDYLHGLDTLDGYAADDPASFGFVTLGNERFESLTDRWRAFIERRRNQRQAA